MSLVAGGERAANHPPDGSTAALSAGPERCTPAKAGAQTGEAVRALRASGPLPPQGYWNFFQPPQPTLSELFAAQPRDAGWAGFLLAQLGTEKPLLWVQERMAILESGRVHPPGLPTQNLIHVEARDARDALWAMEEGLRCSGLSAVVGELWGDPKALDFTATRRLAVASERSGVAAFLIRLGGHANLSGARMRWRIASAPSLANDLDPKAPGLPAWDAELFRARGMPPGRWTVAHEAGAFDLVAAPGDRALGEGKRLTA
ncbi:MAG TPA: recA-like protein [Sphingomicrobium sp.]|nr:recA-like protein [Sphingomicrobium sp.]